MIKSGKTILFVGGGLEATPGIRLAKSLGLRVVVSDGDLTAPGMLIADDQLHASTYNIPATLDSVTKYVEGGCSLSGVICLGTDVPMTVATIAQSLGLTAVSIETAALASNKLAMKERFTQHGVRVPWFSRVDSIDHLRSLSKEHSKTLVIKPVDSRGARGVLKFSPTVDLNWAFNIALENSPTARVMVEEFLDGPQISTESLIINGICHTPGFSDRNYEYLERFAPNIIENGGDLPSAIPLDQQEAVRRVVASAATALGVTNGVVKGDIVLHKGEPYVIELATRLSGGYFCTHEIPLNTGVDFVGAAIRQCLGETAEASDLEPRYQRGVSQRYFFPKPGVVREICVPGWISEDPDIALFEMRVKTGDRILPAYNHPARAGLVITTGLTREEAISKANHVIDAVKIHTD